MPQISRTNLFTLLEVILVISIVMIITAISFAYVARTPSGLFLQSTTGKIEELLMSAQMQASLRGTQRNVLFDIENRIFLITDPIDEGKDLPFEDIDSRTADSPESKFSIPATVGIEIPNFKGDRVEYCFYPDGTASGPEINILLKGRKISLTVSQLTGIVLLKEIDSE